MNGAQLHLLTNHLPVIIPLVGMAVLLVGMIAKSGEIRKVGLWILLASALTAIPAYLSGSGAERQVKNYPGVSRNLIHEHEKAAKFAFIFNEVVGAACLLLLLALHLGKKTRPELLWFVLLACLFTFVVMARTAHLGGKIRHEEIRAEEISSGRE